MSLSRINALAARGVHGKMQNVFSRCAHGLIGYYCVEEKEEQVPAILKVYKKGEGSAELPQ